MFYASKHGSRAHSATEGEERGVVTADSVICRYDYFVNSRTIIPPAELERCKQQPHLLISFRSEIWNQHRNLPAGLTGPLMNELDCRRTVRQLHGDMTAAYKHLADYSEAKFVKAVGRVYRGLEARASSREFFLSSHPFDVAPPTNVRPFARVQFSEPPQRRGARREF